MMLQSFSESSMLLSAQSTSILELFQEQVRETPNAEAIVFEDRSLSFLQLDDLAGCFATALAERGVGFGQSVGLCIDRCPEAIAAMLGAFKLGAVFVPLDPEYPLERIRYMMDDAQIRVIITHERETNALATSLDQALDVMWIDSATEEFQRCVGSSDFEAVELAGSDLAYIMYTSGSTGRPKGVLIDHTALTTYCLADIEVYRLQASDRTLQFSTLNFDIAIEEIFPPLLVGSCVVVRPRGRSTRANELSTIVRQYGVTALHLATAYWHEWVDLMKATGDRVPESLRMVLATGEKVSVEHYRRWLGLCDQPLLWCNAYGPTEATVTSTVYIPEGDFQGDHMPIGKPLPGYEAFILSEDHRPLGIQETGLLFIAGPALARGYLNRPDLTEKAFITVDLPERGPTRMYRTGDLARWLPDGNIEFAGRIDHQIKLGSYRIEPGEIESVLSKHPQVRDSLVVFEQVAGQNHLIAYVATHNTELKIEELVVYLRERLPVYMVPPRYVLIESLPKTINGKIDRAALPSPETSRTAAHNQYRAPRSELESKLCAMWQQVLHLERVGISDDFFALGGSSLLVTRVIAELSREFAIELPVRDFFANPTVSSAARHLEGLLGTAPQVDPAELELELSRTRASLPILHSQFIGPSAQALFSVRYEPPPAYAQGRRHAILICHPYGHEYTRAYRNLQQLSLQLSREGFDVMRFDYGGTGNSAGNSQACNLETMCRDAVMAAEHLRVASGCQTLSLLGVRLGALVAATASVPDVDSVILWDPLANGSQLLKTFDELHRYALESQTRFMRKVKNARPGQLFGHATSEAQRESFANAQLPATCNLRNLVLTSQGVLSNEPALSQRLQGWNWRATDDDIYWWQPQVTELAFASPDTAQQITQFLDSGDQA